MFFLFCFVFSVTAPFYLEDTRRIQDSKRREWRSVWGGRKRERERARMHAGERVREKALWLLLLYVFSSTWACPMQIGLSQECCLFCLFCLKSSLWSSDLPLTFLVFQPLPFWTPFPYSTYLIILILIFLKILSFFHVASLKLRQV